MQMVEVNNLAVLVAAVIQMALGAFWYSPAGFGKKWAALMGWNASEMKAKMQGNHTKEYAIQFVGSLLIAYVMAHVIAFSEATTVAEGLQGGFWMWLGFIAPVLLGTVLWDGKSWHLYAINAGYYLVGLLLMSALFVSWM